MNLPISVLLVDDDQLVSTCISMWLEDEGFTVFTACSGAETLRLMESTPIGVALVDLHLGDMDGEELIVRASALHPATRFMIHTGTHFYQVPATLMELGMRQQDVVFKPVVELDALSTKIRQMITGVKTNDAV